MRASDMLFELRDQGLPVEDVPTVFNLKAPKLFVGGPNGIYTEIEGAFTSACNEWHTKRKAAQIAQAGWAAQRLIVQHARSSDRVQRVEWREDLGAERALGLLLTQYGAECTANALSTSVYAFGTHEHLKPFIEGGFSRADDRVARTFDIPGIQPKAYSNFMSLTVALCPVDNALEDAPFAPFPVIVARNAYAVGYSLPPGRAAEGLVTVGVMPQRKHLGVTGAALGDCHDLINARLAAPLTFDPNDIRERMRLRRLLAKQGDNE